MAEVADNLVVIHTDHRNLVRNHDVDAPAGLQELQSPLVTAGHDPDWFGKAAHPRGDLRLFVFPRRRVGPANPIKNVARKARFHDDPLEQLAPQVHPEVFARRQTKEAKLPESTIRQVLEGKFYDGAIIESHMGKADVSHGKSQVDGGQTRLADHFRHFAILDACENAVSIPVLQPFWWRRAQVIGMNINGPRAVSAQVAVDAEQHAAAVGSRSLDQKRHLGNLRHRTLGSGQRSRSSTTPLEYPASGQIDSRVCRKIGVAVPIIGLSLVSRQRMFSLVRR